MLRSFVGWLLIASVSVVSAVAQEAPPVPSNAEIRKILAERIDKETRGVGIVVGVIEPAGRRIVAHGTFAKTMTVPLTAIPSSKSD